METIARQQRPTASKKRATNTVVQNVNLNAIRQRKSDDTFDATSWEKKLYVNGEVFSNNFVPTQKLFTLWSEGVENSEIMFANYQQSLLYVLQHLYSYHHQMLILLM